MVYKILDSMHALSFSSWLCLLAFCWCCQWVCICQSLDPHYYWPPSCQWTGGWGGAPRHPPSLWLGIQHMLASPLANYPSTEVNLPQNTSADRKPVILSLSQVQSAGWMHGRLNGWFDVQYVCMYVGLIDAWVDTSLIRIKPSGSLTQ